MHAIVLAASQVCHFILKKKSEEMGLLAAGKVLASVASTIRAPIMPVVMVVLRIIRI